ncbi:molybdopterin-dependent oxidoreductase [Clostridiaceae bacterium HSG29]|nr:molybdopterin-dependent oxidoreductase [Clostridiaceae bacterium HSG29]
MSNKKLVMLLVLVVVLMVGCATVGETVSDELAYEGGLKIVSNDIEKTVLYNDIYKMENTTVEMKNLSSSGETAEVEVTGASLLNIIEEMGIDINEVASLRFIAGDGYEIDVPKEIFDGKDIILAYKFDGENLFEPQMPLRTAINDVRSMYWVINLVEIDINLSSDIEVEDVVDGNQVYYILEEAVKSLETEDYSYYDATDSAIRVKDLFEKYVDNTSNSVKFIATDNFEKTEELDILMDGYIKITGENAPLFTSPDMPAGMQVKNIVSLKCGNTTFLTGKLLQDKFTQKKVRNKSGASLEEIVTFLDITSDKIEFFASDGYSAQVERNLMNEGILNLMDDTTYQIKFSEVLDKSTSIKEVLKFTTVNEDSEIVSPEVEENSDVDSIWEIEISGLSDGDFNLGSEKANRKLEKVKLEATKVKKDGTETTQEWTGYKVNDILSFLKVEDYNAITFISSDGYEVELIKGNIDDETIVAISVDGENLTYESQIQLVVKNQTGNMWVKSLKQMIIK